MAPAERLSTVSSPFMVGSNNTAKNILGIAHPKHTILLLVSRKLEGNSGYFALLVASNQIYCLSEIIFLN